MNNLLPKGVNTVTQRQYTKMKKKSQKCRMKKAIDEWSKEPCIFIPHNEEDKLKIEPLTPSQVAELLGDIKLVKSKRQTVTVVKRKSGIIGGKYEEC